MAHRPDRNGMKQGSATTEFKDMPLHRNRYALRPKEFAWPPNGKAKALPALVGKRRRYDIANVGRLFRA